MKAIVLEQYGGPEQLRLAEHADPKVAPGEVLIKVEAAAINPVDWKIADGCLDERMEIRFPLIPGWDVAGTVAATGIDTADYAIGDTVIGYVCKDTVELGTYAELVSANVRLLARKPDALGWAQAAGLPLAGLTAYQTLRRARLSAGETVLIHAAAGGVGALGTQLAVARGARVIGTASERNHDFLRELGAEPVSYGDGLAERVRELAPNGVHAVADFVGGDAVTASRELVGDPSRIVSIASPAAAELGGHMLWVRPDHADLTALAELADAGKLTVPVHAAMPLAEAAEAWRINQAGHTRGKLALIP